MAVSVHISFFSRCSGKMVSRRQHIWLLPFRDDLNHDLRFQNMTVSILQLQQHQASGCRHSKQDPDSVLQLHSVILNKTIQWTNLQVKMAPSPCYVLRDKVPIIMPMSKLGTTNKTAVNMQGFVWKFVCAIRKFWSIHSPLMDSMFNGHSALKADTENWICFF